MRKIDAFYIDSFKLFLLHISIDQFIENNVYYRKSARTLQNWLLIKAIQKCVKSWKNLLASLVAPVDLWVVVSPIFQVWFFLFLVQFKSMCAFQVEWMVELVELVQQMLTISIDLLYCLAPFEQHVFLKFLSFCQTNYSRQSCFSHRHTVFFLSVSFFFYRIKVHESIKVDFQ